MWSFWVRWVQNTLRLRLSTHSACVLCECGLCLWRTHEFQRLMHAHCTQTRAMNKAVYTRIRHTWRERNDMHMSHALYLVVLTTAPTTEVRMQAQTGERRIFLETSHRIWIHKCIQNHCTHATHATLVSAFHSTVKIYMLYAFWLEEKWEEFTRQHASTPAPCIKIAQT